MSHEASYEAQPSCAPWDSAVLVVAGWGDDVLWAEEVALGSPLTLPESFVDQPWTLLTPRPGRETVCVVPAHVALDDGHSEAAENRAASRFVSGATEIALRKRTRLRLQLGGERWITVGMVRASPRVAKVTPRRFLAGLADRWTALSLFAHLALLAVSALCVLFARPAPSSSSSSWPASANSVRVDTPDPATIFDVSPRQPVRRTAADAVLDSVRLDTNGLPAEVVRRIVRLNLGRARYCYLRALRVNPRLEGLVVTNLIIARDGEAVRATDGVSSLPNDDVRRCIAQSYEGISFPPPEGPPLHVQLVVRLRPIPWDSSFE